MSAYPSAWPHQVIVRLTLPYFREKLHDIEEWLRMWEIPYRIGATVGPAGAVRICFAEEKFTRAFVFNKGGTIAPPDDIETAMLEDEADEAECQRLADGAKAEPKCHASQDTSLDTT